ncbi:MAG: sel1 repeat family protein [Anaerotruncus sp.]|nr:sel1 repeat family protein [Anaerotruncus sp.]
MGKYFSDVVEQGIADIYYCYDKERAAAALQPLINAAAAGDGDAAYLVSRCLSGPQYSWTYHTFQENDEGVEYYIRQSIRNGSAIGVLGSMRCGMLTPEMEAIMPFDSIQDAWNVVLEKAENGSQFCQNMIGNTYFWLDIVRIEGKDADSFPNKKAFASYLRECTLACIPWFEKAFRNGMGFAGRNLYNLYKSGEEGLVEPQPEKADEVEQLGASLGYPDWQEQYGKRLLKTKGKEQEGLALCEAAAAKGQLSAWYSVANAYKQGKIVPKDLQRAMAYCEKGLEDPKAIGCANIAGEMYYLGKDGIAQDYAKAVELFERAHRQNNDWGNDMLGTCYLFGYGCEKNPVRARELFEEADYTSELIQYGLGLIYADGLGVKEDIKKGVEYLQKAKDYAPAQEALRRFKKTMFGKWVRK